MQHIYDMKSGTLQVHTNDISLRKCSGGSAQLRIVDGTLPESEYRIRSI